MNALHKTSPTTVSVVAGLTDAQLLSVVDECLATLSSRQRVLGSTALMEFAERNGVSVPVLTGASRRRPVAEVRQAAYAYVRQRCPHLSLPQIGRLFGDRDHTTILHGIRKHAARLAQKEAAE